MCYHGNINVSNQHLKLIQLYDNCVSIKKAKKAERTLGWSPTGQAGQDLRIKVPGRLADEGPGEPGDGVPHRKVWKAHSAGGNQGGLPCTHPCSPQECAVGLLLDLDSKENDPASSHTAK